MSQHTPYSTNICNYGYNTLQFTNMMNKPYSGLCSNSHNAWSDHKILNKQSKQYIYRPDPTQAKISRLQDEIKQQNNTIKQLEEKIRQIEKLYLHEKPVMPAIGSSKIENHKQGPEHEIYDEKNE